ncbi:MAG: flagellar protein FlaF [Magnetospirillum sp. WYHS-4]
MKPGGYGAYSRTSTASLSGRRLEGQAFAKAAALLAQAVDHPAALAKALRFNNNLWTVVQADVAGPDSRLPEPLKGQIVALSLFMDKQTFALLAAGHDRKALEAMAAINRSLASGLLQSQG